MSLECRFPNNVFEFPFDVWNAKISVHRAKYMERAFSKLRFITIQNYEKCQTQAPYEGEQIVIHQKRVSVDQVEHFLWAEMLSTCSAFFLPYQPIQFIIPPALRSHHHLNIFDSSILSLEAEFCLCISSNWDAFLPTLLLFPKFKNS